jgi:hypothetical protein
MNEQELKAWSLLIAALIKGGFNKSDNANVALAYYEPLAEGIADHLRGVPLPMGQDPRFQSPHVV